MNLPALGFCTDGDWALKHDGIHQLMQGADERYTGKVQSKVQHDILFAGSVTHPPDRHRQIKDLERTYGDRLLALYPDKLWTFGRKFAKKIAESKIVISLRLPASDNYWSNRVYVVSGFGGFLIHPYCKQLANHYVEGEEIVFYRTEDELKKKIDYYLPLGEERKRISANALQRTLQEHTYTHRCKQLIRIVKEQLL
jgi:glycosyltransferase involved in cell wall biosynthesis